MDNIDALVDSLPDEVVDYIADLEEQLEAASETAVAKSAEQMATITKRLDDLEAENASLRSDIAKARTENADADYVAKARSFDGVIDDPAEFGPKLRAIADMDPDVADAVEKALSAAAERIAKGALFAEMGVGGGAPTDAEDRIATFAKSLVEADPSLDEASARAMAWEAHPDLYDEHLAEQRARSRA